jgi:hypothetical protein
MYRHIYMSSRTLGALSIRSQQNTKSLHRYLSPFSTEKFQGIKSTDLILKHEKQANSR